MKKEMPGPKHSSKSEAAHAARAKRPYRKPEVLSVEMLEVVAATCDGGKAEFTGLDNCGTIGPIQS